MNDYTYEIVSFVPADSWAKVKYEREGNLPYFKLMTLASFDELAIKEQIEGFAPVVFAHWDRANIAPDELPLVGVQTATMTPIKPTVMGVEEEISNPITEILVDQRVETETEITFSRVVETRPENEWPSVAIGMRDFLLSQTDRYAISDSTMPVSIKAYRQALRDVPLQDGFPDNIVWPEAPVVAEDDVPASISPRQARLALAAQGLLAQVDASIAAMPDGVKESVQIEWEYATEIARDSVLTSSLGAQIGLNEEGLDALFKAAATL